jgi:hypothetical protein
MAISRLFSTALQNVCSPSVNIKAAMLRRVPVPAAKTASIQIKMDFARGNGSAPAQ